MNQREVIPLKQGIDLKLSLPGSKSITNRVFLCAALAKGKTRIYGSLFSDDTMVMLEALKKLKIGVRRTKDYVEITGCEQKFEKKGKVTLDLHNAGTAVRFLTAAMCVREGETVITGTKRMQERPIADLIDGLKQLGFEIEATNGCPPIRISKYKARNSKEIRNYNVRIKGDKSSQYFSALLMLAPLLDKPVTIEVVGDLVSKPYIDTTIAVLKGFCIKVKNNDYKSFEIKPQKYESTGFFYIEGDASAASYWSALTFMHGGSLEFDNLNVKKSIQGDINFPEALKQLKKRSPRTIDMEAMPDAAMTLAVTAPFVKGETKITGLSTLKIKETDRLKALKDELKKVGVKARITKDSITVVGPIVGPVVDNALATIGPTRSGSTIGTYNDHRMAMCFAVLGTMVGATIDDPGCTDKTYPTFWEDLERAYLAPLNLGDRHLVLTGMRGAGKTHLGKRIAKHLGRKFLDIDEAIEKEQGMTIWEMVEKKGWGYFRDIEQNFCSRIAIEEKYAKEPYVISSGGGCILEPENVENLKQNAVMVLIFADPQALAARVMAKKSRPPLKKGQDPAEEIGKLWEARKPLYLKHADVVWDNTSGEVIKASFDQIFA